MTYIDGILYNNKSCFTSNIDRMTFSFRLWDTTVAECCPGGIEDESSCDFESSAINSLCETSVSNKHTNMFFIHVYIQGTSVLEFFLLEESTDLIHLL